jgi:hypothetical protein
MSSGSSGRRTAVPEPCLVSIWDLRRRIVVVGGWWLVVGGVRGGGVCGSMDGFWWFVGVYLREWNERTRIKEASFCCF